LASCVHCFCSCVSPRAPRSTLFPYTTLFRSAEAAVVGADDATTGQAIVAYVILRESAPEDTDRLELIDELRATVSREISPIAKPRDITIVPELPKTRSGKIMRRLLKDMAEGRE